MAVNTILPDDLLLLIDSVSDYAIMMLDVNGVITSWNKGAENIKGYTSEEAIGKNFSMLYLPDDIKENVPQGNLHQAVLHGSYSISAPRMKKDGSSFWGFMVITALYDDDRKLRGFAKITQDITKQKQLQDEIERLHINFESDLKAQLTVAIKETIDYKQALDESAIVAIIDQKGIITKVNDKFCQISQYSREELIGKENWIINSKYYERTFIKNLWKTIAKGDIWKGELRNLAKDGSFYWLDTTIVPFIDQKNIPYQYISIQSDITFKKQSEEKLEKANQDLKEQKKNLETSNELLEQFAFAASHDLQEPLRMVTNYLTQLEKKYNPVLDDKARTYISFAVDGAKRMRIMILDLLNYSLSGQVSENLEQVDLNELIKDILSFFQNTVIGKGARIEHCNLPTVISFRSPLQQVFQNLIGNALKYHRKGILPILNISFIDFENHYQFNIKDNGIGISEKYFEKIFVMFQRLHGSAEYKGTGMGLALTKKIVTRLGGEIWLESVVGEGTTFYFTMAKNKEQ